MNTNALFSQLSASILKDVRTCLPAQVISFDPNDLTVNVQPLIQGVRVSKDGTATQLGTGETVKIEDYDLPPIVKVPLSMLWNVDKGITLPISAGMQGILLVCDRDIRLFKNSQALSRQASLRMFNMNDSFFLPSLPKKAEISDYSADSVEIRNGATKLSVKSSGVEITGGLIVDGIDFGTHVHPYTDDGTPMQTGEPE